MTEFLKIEKFGDITHIKITAETLLTSEKIRSIRKSLFNKIDSNPKSKYIINLEDVENVGSAFLSLIAQIQTDIADKSSIAKYVNVNATVAELFELAGLMKIIEIHTSVDKALMSFSQEMFNSKP